MFERLSRCYYNRGLELAHEDHISEALENLSRAIGCDTDFVEAWNLAGLCCCRLGKYRTAQYCWQRSLEKKKDNEAVGYLADINDTLSKFAPLFTKLAFLCEQNLIQEAEAYLETEIINRMDISADPLNLLGLLQLLGGKTETAVKTWNSVLAIDKSNPDALKYLANAGKPYRSRFGRLFRKLVNL